MLSPNPAHWFLVGQSGHLSELSFLICKMGSNPRCTGLRERTQFREYLWEVPSDSMHIFKHLN